MMGRVFVALGGILGASGVGMAALTAHALSHRLDASALQALHSAVQMQLWHALALVLCGLWVTRAAGLAHRIGSLAGAGFCVGTLLFCGAIYGRHLIGLATGPLAPVGGIALILSWLALTASALAAKPVR